VNPSDGALIAAAGALLLLALAAALCLEAYLLVKGHKPITTYTRNAIEQWPGFALTVAGFVLFVIGALGAHFIWDAGCG
jgi:hypothetical protein